MDVWELGPRGRNGYYAWPSHREKKRGEGKKGRRKGCPPFQCIAYYCKSLLRIVEALVNILNVFYD